MQHLDLRCVELADLDVRHPAGALRSERRG